MLDYFLRQLLRLAEPVGFAWLVLILLTVAAWRRRAWLAAAAAGLLVALITAVGCTDLPGFLLRGLEQPWAGVKPESLPVCDAVVVLGGGAEPSRHEAGGMHLTKAGDRLVMGLELMRLQKAGVLVLGGGAAEFPEGTLNEADVVRSLLAAWRLPAGAETLSLGACRHTRDEAEKVAALAGERGWKRVLLVTSAWHMRRAAATFRAAGVDAVPAPCNFLTTVSTAPGPFQLAVPGWQGFEKVSIWAHEHVGWVLYRRRGWVAE